MKVLDVDMFTSASTFIIFGEEYGSTIIAEDLDWSLYRIDNFETTNKNFQPNCLCSDFIARNKFCLHCRCSNYSLLAASLGYTPPARRKIYSEVDFLLSTHPTKSESEYPTISKWLVCLYVKL